MFLTGSIPAVVLEAGHALTLLVTRFAHPRWRSWQEHRGDAFERLAGVAVGVDTHVVAVIAAQNLPDGLLIFLADDVQQGGLDSVDGMEDQARRGVDCAGMHTAQQAIYGSWVFANQNGGEP